MFFMLLAKRMVMVPYVFQDTGFKRVGVYLFLNQLTSTEP